jgi:hypothetical protein
MHELDFFRFEVGRNLLRSRPLSAGRGSLPTRFRERAEIVVPHQAAPRTARGVVCREHASGRREARARFARPRDGDGRPVPQGHGSPVRDRYRSTAASGRVTGAHSPPLYFSWRYAFIRRLPMTGVRTIPCPRS